MSVKTNRLGPVVAKKALATFVAACFSGGALAAVDFEFGDGWQGQWLTTMSIGTSWRAESPDSRLYGPGNGALAGLPGGTGNNTIDEGNLNYRKGDRFSTLAKVISEVSFKKGQTGGLIRAKAWYDYTLNKEDVHFGNQPNGYNGFNGTSLGSNQPLSDKGYDSLLKFQGVQLLDAYVYDTWDVGNQALQVRFGRHVLNWGESVFIQGVNQINPIDVPAARRPGAELKEVFMPIWMLSASQSLGKFGTVEAFYQLKWEATPVEAGCGNYWSVAQGNIAASPGACFNASALSHLDSTPNALATGNYITTLNGQEAKNSGQFGVAYRFNLDPVDTEFGLYAMNIHSRLPVFSLKYGDFRASGSASPMAAYWEYPEDMKVYGISAATNILGWSVSAELSQTHDFNAQLDGNDMFYAGFGAGPLVGLGNAAGGPLVNAGGFVYNSPGTLHGGVKTNKNQFQINALQAGNEIAGADQWLVVGEVGFQWNSLNLDSGMRFNRPFIFGPGPDAGYGGSTCGAALNINKDGCTLNEGYVTKNAWGYRLLGQLTYNNVFGSGVAASPRIFWSQDVKGYAVDGAFVEDRTVLGLGMKLSYDKRYTFDFSYNQYGNKAKFDPLRDRDYFSATFSAAF